MTKLIGKPQFRGFMVRCEPVIWMTSELAKNWLEVVWNRCQGFFCENGGDVASGCI
jgi:hypothetical protein